MKMGICMCIRVSKKFSNVWLELHVDNESSSPGIRVRLVTSLCIIPLAGDHPY